VFASSRLCIRCLIYINNGMHHEFGKGKNVNFCLADTDPTTGPPTMVSSLTSVSRQGNNTDHSAVTSLQRCTNAFPESIIKRRTVISVNTRPPPHHRPIAATLFMRRTRFVICHGIEKRRPNINFHFPQKLPEQILHTPGCNCVQYRSVQLSVLGTDLTLKTPN